MRIIAALLIAAAASAGELARAQVRTVERFGLTWTQESGWGKAETRTENQELRTKN
jgi:hypothetical protein